MTTKFLMAISLVLIAVLGISCDLGTNPLLLDGSPVTATFRVDKVGTHYDTTVTVDLNDVASKIDKDIDSIKVFNITLQIDSTAGTDPSTRVSGYALIDGDTLLTVSGDSIRQFATERSIFDSTLAGGPIFKNAGVARLVAILDAYKVSRSLPTVTMKSSGDATSSPLHFTIKLRLYTQVFTPPPKN